MSLRVTLDYHADEARISLLSRLAMANSYPSLRSFLALNGTSVTPFNAGSREAIQRLSNWSGLDAELLRFFDITNAGQGATWRLGSALMGKDMRPGLNHRYCPKCVVHDLETGHGRVETRPYVRANWMTRAVQNCVDHRCALVETPFDRMNPGDFALFVKENRATIRAEAEAATPRRSIDLDEYVTARIHGRPSNDFLDQLEAYVAVDLCKHIGEFEKRHLSKGQLSAQSTEISDIEKGFAIASNGAAAVSAVISSAADRKRPAALEMKVFFGKLRPWLLRNLTKPEFAPLVELFQSAAEKSLPIGENDVFILPTKKRHLHSVRSASTEYHIMEDRVYQLVLDAGLTAPSKLTSGRIYFDANAGHEVLSAARDTMTSRELATALGIHIDRLRPLLDANYIARVEMTEDTRVYSRVRRADFDDFAKKLSADTATDEERERLVSMNHAGRFAFCTLNHVIELVLSKKLRTLRRIDDTGLISGLGVDPEEIKPFSIELRRQAAETSMPVFDYQQATPACSMSSKRGRNWELRQERCENCSDLVILKPSPPIIPWFVGPTTTSPRNH